MPQLPVARFIPAGADPATLPLALSDLHRSADVGQAVHVTLGAHHGGERVMHLFIGAGFTDVVVATGTDARTVTVHATRARSLADSVGAGMRLLVVGLNPSLYAADAGIGFARPGNRFWPALAAAGITEDERNPIKLLQNSGVGMTDLVKRASARADELTTDEYRSGLDRLDDLCVWLAPRAVCFLGLAGWRAAVERSATTGWQTRAVGGCPAYVMGNPSGLNAHDTVESLAAHLRRALEGPPEKRDPIGS